MFRRVKPSLYALPFVVVVGYFLALPSLSLYAATMLGTFVFCFFLGFVLAVGLRHDSNGRAVWFWQREFWR